MKLLMLPTVLLCVVACANEPETEAPDPVSAVSEAETPTVNERTGRDWWNFDEWDIDSDQQLNVDEFRRLWERGFAEWDVDDDGALSADESADAFRNWFDLDDDQVIDQNEWTKGARRWSFEGVDWGSWADWDADSDGEVTETEWRDRWSSHVWNGWTVADDQGSAARDELHDTLWSFFDRNGDDIIDAAEWNRQSEER